MTVPTNREANEINHLPADDREFEELEIAEEELIDAYLRDELSDDERKLVEKGLRSSSRLVERFHFAKMLAQAASSVPQNQTSGSAAEFEASLAQHDPKRVKPPWWKAFLGFSFVQLPAFRIALGACVLLVLIGSAALFAGWMKLRSETQRLDSERVALDKQRQELEKTSAEQQSKSEQLSAELQKERQREQDQKLIEALKRSQKQNDQSNSPAPIVASLLLLPGSTRDSSGGNELIVPSGASTVRLKLGLEANDYSSYGAVIKNAQGVKVFQRNRLKARSGKLTVQVPAQRLPPGDYTVHVSGVTSARVVESVHDYAFRVR
ncbi:MAG: hypothetical protein QOH71_1365 [Blastocatellia bacterium]|nr:hypothetical protein [Blastocatellia bacterium]